MKKGVVALFVFLLVIPLAYSMPITDLVSKYLFSKSTADMNITSHSDFMADNDNDGVNDTLYIELTTSNKQGNFIFVLNLFDGNAIVNESNITLPNGANKVNISFASIYLSQSQFNYSIRIYNSSYSLRYRKDKIPTNIYSNYEEGFKVMSMNDSRNGNKLDINITLNSSVTGLFESTLFLKYNNSLIPSKINASFNSRINKIVFSFDNETIKRTHYSGKYNISSIKIGKKIVKTNFTTNFYYFQDFASSSYISKISDTGVDTDSDNRYDFIQANVTLHIISQNDYSLALVLYDLFDNIIEIKNISYSLDAGNYSLQFNFNGSKIYDKKLNGPFAIKNVALKENNTLVDILSSAYVTKSYNYNDFDASNLPDLIVNISLSDGYHYGINNITANFTFRNIGNKHALNVFTYMLDNDTFSKTNKSSIINIGSELKYQINFTNFTDFELSAFVDLNGVVEELNESNNAFRAVIVLNRRPNLTLVYNLTLNETDRLLINLSASDSNGDNLSYSINSSRFSGNGNLFQWDTTTTDSGNYTLMATVSDGYLNDSFLFHLVVFDVSEKDSDNDGINDTMDTVIGDAKSVKTSTFNLTILLNNSNNLSRHFNNVNSVRILDSNITIAEFDLNFSLYKLNLSNLAINKQSSNSTGSLVISGLSMPAGSTKTIYVDRLNNAVNGLCIKDEDILSISEISSNCNSNNEFLVECDGTLQGSYKCSYNSSLNKYKVEGLKNSGVIQFDYSQKKPQSTGSSPSVIGTGGGGGGVFCISDWQCSSWSECADGLQIRKCEDKSQCTFSSGKPEESRRCKMEKPEEKQLPKSGNVKSEEKKLENKMEQNLPQSLSMITGKAIETVTNQKFSYMILVIIGIIFLVVGYFTIKEHTSR